MKELPEGLFDMPSGRGQFRYQWDQLVRSCLQNNPSKRPEYLLKALEEIIPERQPQGLMQGTKRRNMFKLKPL